MREVPWLAEGVERVERLLQERVTQSPHAVVSEPSAYLLNAGGKRLRPALVLLASHAGEPGRPETDKAAAAVELVHIATLYHDDIIDRTDFRRGVPTVHAKWGEDVAVLAGDYLFATSCVLGAEAGGEVPLILGAAVAEVCEGQILETGTPFDPMKSVDRYIDVIQRKTGALIRAACELGATTSGASAEARRALVDFGYNVGIAFQLVDDLLDLVGDEAVTGKPVGTDLREGVLTVPVLLACQREPELAEMLIGGEKDLERVLPYLHSTAALEDAMGMATDHGRKASAALETLEPGEWREVLETVVDGVLGRVPALSRDR